MVTTELTDQEERTKLTYNKVANAWSSMHANPDFWKEEIDQFQTYLPKGKLLEVGCGGGRDAEQLIKRGYDYVGTDISKGLLAEAERHNPDAEFIEVSLYDFEFAEKFDGFWCSAVLLHVPKIRIQEALISIKNSIKQGGFGFIAIKQGSGEKMEEDERFFAYWQDTEFSKELKKAGFEIADYHTKVTGNTAWLTYIVRKK